MFQMCKNTPKFPRYTYTQLKKKTFIFKGFRYNQIISIDDQILVIFQQISIETAADLYFIK